MQLLNSVGALVAFARGRARGFNRLWACAYPNYSNINPRHNEIQLQRSNSVTVVQYGVQGSLSL